MMTQPGRLRPLGKPWIPKPYQKKAVKFLLEHAAGGLLLDPGLGKTSITLAAIKILKAKGIFKKGLIIAPIRVCYDVWPAQVKEWSDFTGLRVCVLHGPRKEELLSTEADLYVVNPEGLDWLVGANKVAGKAALYDSKRWRSFGFDTLIVDELSKFKNVSSQRFKLMKAVIGSFSRRWGLTGSPAANGLMNLFGQCYILDEGRTFGKYITRFRSEYFDPSWNGFGWTLKEGAEEKIYTRLAPLVLRMAAEDYISMPERIDNFIEVDLPKDARRVYDQMEVALIATIDDETFTASNAAGALNKCSQIANGGIYSQPDIMDFLQSPKSARELIHLHTAKVDALADLVEELQGSPLLVAYNFQHDLDRIKTKLGDVPAIGAGVSPKVITDIITRWNTGEIPVLVGHPQSIGHGLNLQGSGRHVCWLGLTWDYELYDQFNRRVLRQGNKFTSVVIHHIVARDTVDALIIAALSRKHGGQQSLFDALKKRRGR